MKSIILSIKPYWLFLIIAEKMGWNIGKKKTIEIRKSHPKDTGWNKSVILYCTKDYNSLNKVPKEYRPLMRLMLGKAIGEFVCDNLTYIQADYDIDGAKHLYNIAFVFNKMCISLNELFNYLYKGKDKPNGGWAWHISDLKIYDKPKELSEFRKPCIMPEQQYCPRCEVGGEYINETEAEFYRVDGECFTEWVCLNYLKRPPQSWCYVEALK